jgi:hypothetical protein
MNIKWRTFYVQESLIINFNILFIGMGMMQTNAFGNKLKKTYQTPWKRFTGFINDIQTSLSPFLVELVKMGGDVIDANTMEFIHMHVHL